MKLIAIVLTLWGWPVVAKSTSPIIYGKDGRQPVAIFQNQDWPTYFSLSTLARVPKQFLKNRSRGLYFEVNGPTLKTKKKLCDGERFEHDWAIANCSGFLVGPNLVVTAAHCVRRQIDCDNYYWVFDYTQNLISSNQIIEGKSVFSCTAVLERFFDKDIDLRRDEDYPNKGIDWALISLDRPVRARPFLRGRIKGLAKKGASLISIGHPSGLPLQITDGATIQFNTPKNYFVSNIDSFRGSSGSPVFDVSTGLAEGIFVRGQQDDYIRDEENNCFRSHTVKNRVQDTNSGEDALRFPVIWEQLKKYL